LGEIEEYLQALLGQRIQGFFTGGSGEASMLGGRQATLDLLQIIEDRLFDHPVRRSVDLRSGLFQALAGSVVEFYAKGGGSHGESCLSVMHGRNCLEQFRRLRRPEGLPPVEGRAAKAAGD